MAWIVFSLYYRNRISTTVTNTSHLLPSKITILKPKDVLSDISTSLSDKNLISNTIAPPTNVVSSDTDTVRSIITQPPEPDPDDFLHSIFSTDCSTFQDWQTLLLFHSAKVVKQKGTMTRIASGCSEQKKAELMQLYKQLHPEYHVHFTPDYSIDSKTKKRYEFYNKPYGLLHWLEHADPPIPPNTIIALLDPDFVFIRPLTTRISGQQNILFTTPVQERDLFPKVERGKPVAQQYLLGAPWATNYRPQKSLNRTKICGPNSPCLKVPNPDIGSKYYSVGAPYILERDDMLAVAKSWVDFVPKVYEDYPDLLAEMFAYCMAAAHQNLPHLRLDHYMVSNIHAFGEGWEFIDQLGDRVTEPPINGVYFPNHSLPVFVHYCQFFRSAEFGFHKRRVYGDIFSCHRPLLLDMPADGRLAKVNYKNRDGEVLKLNMVS